MVVGKAGREDEARGVLFPLMDIGRERWGVANAFLAEQSFILPGTSPSAKRN